MDYRNFAQHTQRAVNRRQVVEQAEAFLNAHRGDPVPIEYLCRVTGVSERTLRNAFHDVRGMSPKRFMLRARLDQVHRALQSRQAARTVTNVATEHGFFELGRFAGQYKAAFGVSPSETLRTGGSWAA